MENTIKIKCTKSVYGNSKNKAYGNIGNVYVATYADSGTTYASRLCFPSVRSDETIGSANIAVSKVTLHLRRTSGGTAEVTAGSSASSAWGAATDGGGTAAIGTSTKWYTIDITDCATAMLNYDGTWYIHLTGSGTRVRCNGAGTDYTPYITIVWDDAANTISTDDENVTLGETVSFNITPDAGDASFTLDYSFGGTSGTIAETSETEITWTPPIDLAMEIPNAESDYARLTLNVYDDVGKLLRTEALYLMLKVPENIKPTLRDNTFTVYSVNGLKYGDYSAILQGKSAVGVRPVVDLDNTYGATIRSITAALNNEGTTETLTWNDFEGTDDVYTGATIKSSTLKNAGTVNITLTVTDSRGRETSATRSINVHTYKNPKISEFAVERYETVYDANEEISGYEESNTGEYVRVTLKASCTDVIASGESRNFITWQITATDTDGATTVYSGGGDTTGISMDRDRTVITAKIPVTLAVEYTVMVTDTAGYTVYGYDSVTQGRANFALAGSKYGVSVGCMPNGTESKPMFESAYPFYPYGGIEKCSGVVKEISLEPESKFALYGESSTLCLRTYGNIAQLIGEVTPTAAISGSTTEYAITEIPAEYAPKHIISRICQGSATNLWMVRVYPADSASRPCKVTFGRYRNSSSYSTASAGSWLPFEAMWIAGDAAQEEEQGGYTNQVPISIDTDGSVYNGAGFKNGYRVSSSGAEKADASATCTGYIPVSGGDVIRISGWTRYTNLTAAANAINAYDASFANIGQIGNANYGIFASGGSYVAYNNGTIVDTSDVSTWVVPPSASGVAYIRVSAYDYTNGAPGEKLTVTVNQEIS